MGIIYKLDDIPNTVPSSYSGVLPSIPEKYGYVGAYVEFKQANDGFKSSQYNIGNPYMPGDNCTGDVYCLYYPNGKIKIPISNAEDLHKIGAYPDYPSYGYYILTNDLIGTQSYKIGSISCAVSNVKFTGVIDGQGHTVSLQYAVGSAPRTRIIERAITSFPVITLNMGCARNINFVVDYTKPTYFRYLTEGLALNCTCTQEGSNSDYSASCAVSGYIAINTFSQGNNVQLSGFYAYYFNSLIITGNYSQSNTYLKARDRSYMYRWDTATPESIGGFDALSAKMPALNARNTTFSWNGKTYTVPGAGGVWKATAGYPEIIFPTPINAYYNNKKIHSVYYGGKEITDLHCG